MLQNLRELRMSKAGHTYIFRYSPGDEGTMMMVLATKADDQSCHLDWLDGAVLASRVSAGTVKVIIGEVT